MAVSKPKRRGISDLVDTYLDCRTLNHAWEKVPDDGLLLRAWHNTKTNRRKMFRCLRCTMKRYDVWNRFTGEVLARSYKQPEGYALSGRILGKTFRKAAMDRFDK